MKMYILTFIIFTSLQSLIWGQITLEKVSKVIILDHVNWNYESVNSVEYEIDVKNGFKFYKTGRIPKAQFVQEQKDPRLKALKPGQTHLN